MNCCKKLKDGHSSLKATQLKVLTKRQPAPYGNCINGWEGTWENMRERDIAMDKKLFEIIDWIPPYSQQVCRSCPTLIILFDDISLCNYRIIFKILLKFRYRQNFENITRY